MRDEHEDGNKGCFEEERRLNSKRSYHPNSLIFDRFCG